MGLTRRKDSFYVEFHVFDDGKHLHLAPQGTGKFKRWKVGSRNQRSAKDQEAMIRTKLLKGKMLSPSAERAEAETFREWAETHLIREEVRKLTTYADRKLKVRHLVEYFGDRLLLSISPEDVAAYRAQRMCYPMTTCAGCQKLIGRAMCPGCGWKRPDSPVPASVQTVNHDHTALTHMFIVAKSARFKLILDNPASHRRKARPEERTRPDRQYGGMGQVNRHGSPRSTAILDDCLCSRSQEGRVAQAGMAGRGHAPKGIYAPQDQERRDEGCSNDTK